MRRREKTPWPTFELVQLPIGHLKLSAPRRARIAGLAAGVPRDFFGRRFEALPLPQLVNVPGHRSLVWFGTAGSFKKMFVDPSSGEIFELVEARAAVPRFVNSSLAHFTQTVKAMIARFPFYSSQEASDAEGLSDLPVLRRVAADLGETIRRIDPPSMVSDRFWSTFIDDVENGDFETEAFVPPETRPGSLKTQRSHTDPLLASSGMVGGLPADLSQRFDDALTATLVAKKKARRASKPARRGVP